MPVKSKTNVLQKSSILTVILAVLFIIIYFLIIGYSYKSLVKAAEADVYKSTDNAAVTFSRVLESDASFLELLSTDIKTRGFYLKKETTAERKRKTTNQLSHSTILTAHMYHPTAARAKSKTQASLNLSQTIR